MAKLADLWAAALNWVSVNPTAAIVILSLVVVFGIGIWVGH